MKKYQAEYEWLHAQGAFPGFSVNTHKNQIKHIIDLTESSHILDYGSGMGYQYSINQFDIFWKVEVDCYDPFYPPFKHLPNKLYDGVISIEVMEHIPEEEIDLALSEIFEKAKYFVFVSVNLSPANKTFANGDNVHVLLKDKQWWIDRFVSHNNKNIIVIIVFTEKNNEKDIICDIFQYPTRFF